MLNTFQDNLNFINSKKKIRLTPDFNYIELVNDICQYDYIYSYIKILFQLFFILMKQNLILIKVKIHTGKNFLNVIIF